MSVPTPFLLFVALSLAATSGIAGCTAASDDSEESPDDSEDEPADDPSDELRSSISCREQPSTAYRGGKAYPISVIKIGGKPTAKATGHAFLRLQAAARADHIQLTLNSGFRTMTEQQHLYRCYVTRRCNSGRLAARPGYSNHQSGLALDVKSSTWLARNAPKFGFTRTVPSEAWHYEYQGTDPGGPCSRGPSAPTSVAQSGLTWVAPKQDATVRNDIVLKAHANKSSIVKVVYSQGTFEFAQSTRREADFAARYAFEFLGDKTLTASGYDANDKLVAVDYVDFTLQP
jgi:LAS superfamily LD-carboxypeptidase LdcB